MNKYRNKLVSATVGALALMAGFSACSDDHFEVKTSEASAASVWENMQNDQDLDSLRMILSRTVVMSTNTDQKSSSSYETLLSSAQAVTLWAPVDGTYPAYRYLALLDKADALEVAGQKLEALKLRYNVGREFVQNHIARYNYNFSEMESEVQKGKEVNLLNGKAVRFSKANNTFNAVPLASGFIQGRNGTIYKLNGSSPYIHNLWTYLGASSQFSEFYNALTQSKYDSYTFSELASTPGAMNNSGQMVYIDSVFIHRNVFLSGTSIESEDSMFFAVVPTNAGWANAKATTEALYAYTETYKTSYSATEDNTMGKFRNTVTVNVDSLKELNALRALTRSMLYAPWQYGVHVTEYGDSAQVVGKALYADSLRSVLGEILYNPAADTAQANKNINPFFEQPKNLLRASNGYILPLDEYNIKASYLWQPKEEVLDITHFTNFLLEVDNVTSTASTGTIILLDDQNRNEAVVGEVPYNRYRRFTPMSNAVQLRISIPLRDVFSTNYRIKIQLVPNRINKEYIQMRNGAEVVEKIPVYAQIAYDDDDNLPAVSSDQTSRPFLVDNDSVKEYVLFDNYKFKKSYAGLPSEVNSFARLVLICPPNLNAFGADYRGAAYARTPNASLNIVKVIIEPVR